MIRLLVFSLALAAYARADQLVLKNGDRVTGGIVKKDAKTITMKSDAFGVITAPWDQVESITVDKPLTVVLSGGESVEGTLTTAGGRVEVASKDTKRAVEPGAIEALRNADEQRSYLRLLKPGWGQLWVATGTLGFAGTAGNARTQTFTTGFAASRVTRHDKTTLTFSTIAASAVVNGTSADTAEAIRGGIAYDHNVSDRLFLSGFNNNEYDRFQNLDLRFVAGGGLGLHAVKGERSRLDITGGGNYNRENFSNGLKRNSAEFFWGDDYNFNLTKGITLVQDYRMFNNLSNTGEYRVNFDLGIAAKLTRWLNWNVSASDRYLTNPAPGRKTNDFLYTTGLGVTFAR
jgi:putative salt-induced outer membrane protein YdiY